MPDPKPQAETPAFVHAFRAHQAAIDAIRPPQRKKRRRPKHDELVDAARAALLKRRFAIVRTAEEAVTIWKQVRLYRRGSSVEDALPSVGSGPALVGLPVDEQVAQMVEETPFFEEWRAGRLDIDAEPFMSELQAQLPQEFGHPWQGLCEAEQDALHAEARARLAGGTGLEPSANRGRNEERLMLGFERQNED